jgi:hypothetical protein
MRASDDGSGALAIVVAKQGNVDRADQASLCLLYLQGTMREALRLRQRKAQTGACA